MWCFEVAASLWFGYEFVTFCSKQHFDALQCLFCGAPLAFVLHAWIVFLLSYPLGLTPFAGFLSVVILLVAAFFLYSRNRRNKAVFRFYLTSAQLWTYLAFGALFYIVMNCAMFRNYKQTKGAGYSDLPFQLNIINSFAVGCNNRRSSLFAIWSVFFAGEPLAYPFIPNFHAAMLMDTGETSARWALLIPAVIVVYSLQMGLYSFSYWFTKSHLASILSLVLFFNLGGLGFTHVLDPKHRNDPRRDWIHDWGNNQMEYWFHPIMHILIPQRAALWSLPLCVWSILALSIGVECNNWKMFVLAGVMTGFMPQVQVHAYVAIAQWAITLCLITTKFDKRSIARAVRYWGTYAIIANVMAFPQLLPYIKRVSNARHSFLNINPIWNTPSKHNVKFAPIVLWWRGLGVFSAIALVFGWVTMTNRQMIIYTPSVVVFVIANFVRYQPWELDNTKLFYAAWVPVALPVVSQYLRALVVRPKSILGLVAGVTTCWILVTACGLSALMSTVQSMFWPTAIFGHSDYRFGLWIAENTPPDAIVLMHSHPSNPVACIAGRQVYYGYPGWVHSHGLDMRRSQEQTKLLTHPQDIDAFRQRNISYVVSIDEDHARFDPSGDPHWKLIYKDHRYATYRLLTPSHVM